MFRPNLIGMLQKAVGYDRYGQPSFGAQLPCPFAIVTLDVKNQKTSVRTDSSASRGAADETVADAKILIAKTMKPEIGDLFKFEDVEYVVSGVFVRRSVIGIVDHYECTLEIMP